MPFPLPPDETERLQALRDLNILDTPREEPLDRIARLAQSYFGVPIVLIPLLDERRQWFKSCLGMEAREIAREIAFCAHAILDSKTLIVLDASTDPRFLDNPLVTGPPFVRFYAGMPLNVHGHNVGTICLIDTSPHSSFPSAAAGVLADFAALVVRELEQRLPNVLPDGARTAPAAAPEAERVLEALPLPAYVLDYPNGRFQFLNSPARTLWGVDAASPATLASVAHPADLPSLLTHYQTLAELPHGTFAGLSWRTRAKDNTWTWLRSRETVLARGSAGEPLRLLGVAAILDPPPEAIHPSSQEQERWQMACAAHNDGVFDWNVATGEVFVSERCSETLVLPHAAPSGPLPQWFPSMHAQDRPGVENALENFLAHQSPSFDVEFRVEDPDGALRWLRARASAKWDASGRPVRVAGSLSDITARKRNEVALRLQAEWLAEARDKAEAATRAKSTFLATISHEIRTPINAIVGMTGLLGETPLDRHQKEYVETIRGSGETLLALIADILDFSKIEAGRLELDSVEFAPCGVIEETAELLAGAAYSKGVELVLSLHPSVPARLTGDPGRLRQVLVNLAGNAVKFTSAGHVIVRAEPHHRGGRPTMFFQVTDTGIGIAAEALRRIFEPFVQADSSTTRRYGGTGLGLAIAKQIVECMGGFIGAESEPGYGSRFWFEIPTTVASPAPALPLDLSGRSVLLVEDHAAAREAIREQIEILGCRVFEAPSFEDARELLDALPQNPSFALADFELPASDGYALCAELSSPPRGGYIPIVLMATRENPVSLAETLPPGVHAVISKPIRPGALRDAMSRTLRLDHPAKPSPAPVPAPPAHPARILLAEDNPINQRVAMLMLQRLGFEVDVAPNGHAAVEAWKQGKYPIVLMDCQMPELDGLEATRRIRRLEKPGHRSIIIALTANAQIQDREICELAGMDDYMIKPVRSDLLKAKLDRWLPLASV